MKGLDPLEPEVPKCSYESSLVGTKKCPTVQSVLCTNTCLPYTPNGCDCFGCCTFPALKGKGPGGTDVYVWIGAMDAQNQGTCTLASVTDPKKCPVCTPVGNCLNTCGPCEVCFSGRWWRGRWWRGRWRHCPLAAANLRSTLRRFRDPLPTIRRRTPAAATGDPPMFLQHMFTSRIDNATHFGQRIVVGRLASE
jgi:hypothetical protein